MKRIIIKSVSVLLAVIMISGTLAIGASAAVKGNVRQYGKEGGYLAIGDSISRGCGADGFYIDTDKAEGGQYDLFDLRNVEGAFPYLIAKEVGCNAPSDITDQSGNFWPCTYPGLTVAMMLDLLGVDDDFSDYDLDYMYYDDMLKYFGCESSFPGARNGEKYVEGECAQCGKIDELIKKASLITVQLGMADVFYRTYRIVTSGNSLADGLSFDLSSAESIINLVSGAINLLNESKAYWEKYYPVLIKRIKELNPDADIVMVGNFNLVSDLTLADETMAPLGSLLNGIVSSMNASLSRWEKDLGVIYADISGAETLATEKGWSLLGDFMDNSFAATHPSQNGYNYITRRILSVLPEKEVYGNLALAIGTLDDVDFVIVNGVFIPGYELDEKLLTVPLAPPLGILIIGCKNENEKISIRAYLFYGLPGKGFNTLRLYGNSDALGLPFRPIKLISALFNLISEKLPSSSE